MRYSIQLGILIFAGSFFTSMDCFMLQRNPRTTFHNRFHDQPERNATPLRSMVGLVEMKGWKRRTTSRLFLDFGKFLSDAFGMDNNDDKGKDSKKSSPRSNNQDLNIHGEEDTIHYEGEYGYVGCSNIFKIKVKSLKVGGCRLYLSLFLVGEVNNPEKGTWRMDQNEDGGIDLYYKDATGAMTIMFHEDEITVNRIGSAPSMNYLMSETSLVNGMLDQLDDIAFDTSIEEKDRLILLHEPGDAIDIVRESLSFN